MSQIDKSMVLIWSEDFVQLDREENKRPLDKNWWSLMGRLKWYPRVNLKRCFILI